MNICRKNKILKFIIILFCANCLIAIPLLSQLVQNQTIEFEMPFGNERPDYIVIPLKKGGFVIQERTDALFGRKENIWLTKKYSNDLQLLWSKEIIIPHDVDFGMDCLTQDALFQNFQAGNSKVKLLKIDLEKGDFDWVDGDLLGIQDIFQLKVIGNTAFYSGKFQSRAVVMGLSFFDKTVKAINGLYANHMEVVEIEADEDKKHLHIYSKNKYKGKCELQLRIFDESGTDISNTTIDGEQKKVPFNGRLNSINANEALIIGNYARFCDNFSQGIYIKKINDNIITKSKYLDFSEFKNFFNYLNIKRQKKIEEKLSRKKLAGKSPKFNYSMLVHKLYNINNQLVLLAEIYYPESRTVNGTPFYVAGKDYSPYKYRFTHTIICGFDYEGNKLWDNCLPMKTLTSPYLNEQVQLSQDGHKIILAYPEDGNIKTQVIEESKTIREKEVFRVFDKKDSLWDEDFNGGLSAWNGQDFLVWGVKIVPDGVNISGKKVFFISKLNYKLSVK